MKKQKMLILLLLLACLSGCAAGKQEPVQPVQPEQEQETVQAPAAQAETPEAPEPEYPRGFQMQGQTLRYFDGTSMEPVRFSPGPAEIEGSRYLIEEDGSICQTKEELLHRESGTYYLGPDGTLETFPEGVISIGDRLYYSLEEGESLCTPEPGLFRRENGLYFVQEDGSLLCDAKEGRLYFGSNGAYTSGSEALDEGIRELMETCGAASEEDR